MADRGIDVNMIQKGHAYGESLRFPLICPCRWGVTVK